MKFLKTPYDKWQAKKLYEKILLIDLTAKSILEGKQEFPELLQFIGNENEPWEVQYAGLEAILKLIREASY